MIEEHPKLSPIEIVHTRLDATGTEGLFEHEPITPSENFEVERVLSGVHAAKQERAKRAAVGDLLTGFAETLPITTYRQEPPYRAAYPSSLEAAKKFQSSTVWGELSYHEMPFLVIGEKSTGKPQHTDLLLLSHEGSTPDTQSPRLAKARVFTEDVKIWQDAVLAKAQEGYSSSDIKQLIDKDGNFVVTSKHPRSIKFFDNSVMESSLGAYSFGIRIPNKLRNPDVFGRGIRLRKGVTELRIDVLTPEDIELYAVLDHLADAASHLGSKEQLASLVSVYQSRVAG